MSINLLLILFVAFFASLTYQKVKRRGWPQALQYAAAFGLGAVVVSLLGLVVLGLIGVIGPPPAA